MEILIAEEKDFKELAQLRLEHCYEDDFVYGEENCKNIVKEEFINEFIEDLKSKKDYKIFIVKEKDIIVSCIYIYIIPKILSPNSNSKYIAYLTKVFTKKEYRNKNIGTELLNFAKTYLLDIKCEVLFAWPSENSVKWYENNSFKKENEIFECILIDE